MSRCGKPQILHGFPGKPGSHVQPASLRFHNILARQMPDLSVRRRLLESTYKNRPVRPVGRIRCSQCYTSSRLGPHALHLPALSGTYIFLLSKCIPTNCVLGFRFRVWGWRPTSGWIGGDTRISRAIWGRVRFRGVRFWILSISWSVVVSGLWSRTWKTGWTVSIWIRLRSTIRCSGPKITSSTFESCEYLNQFNFCWQKDKRSWKEVARGWQY